MINDTKPYIPEVYFSRERAEEQLTSWLATDLPCFAIVGDSGVGKTTFMCAAAENLLADEYFVLFYSASSLEEDLREAICNDFVWEFHRERGLAFIVERFDEIARTHGKKLLLFLDGLDRFPGKREKLKAEILDLVPRLRNRTIRLCISCKSFDWEGFIIDNARSYNKLAASICRPLHQTETITQPDARNVGFWLNNFTDQELSQVFPKYQRSFSLHGSLQGMVREACRHPLILRLLAEAWSRRDEPLPQEISQLELFEAYWKMKVSDVRRRLEAERWLCEVAKISVESGKRQVGLDELRARFPSLDHQDETYQDLVRSGLLHVTIDKYGHPMISFGLDTLRAYIYALKVQAWPKKIGDGKSREVAALMCRLLEHTVGLEVVEFYIRTVDRGETRLLTVEG